MGAMETSSLFFIYPHLDIPKDIPKELLFFLLNLMCQAKLILLKYGSKYTT